MHPDVQVALISGSITILVGVMTGIAAYFGAIKGAKTQIEHEKDIMNKNEEDLRNFTEAAIQEFIMREVRSNFRNITQIDSIMSMLDQESTRQYGHNMTFNYGEFELLKHELIKSNNDSVKRVLMYYDLFYLLEEKFDFKMLTQSEFEQFKKTVTIFISNDRN